MGNLSTNRAPQRTKLKRAGDPNARPSFNNMRLCTMNMDGNDSENSCVANENMLHFLFALVEATVILQHFPFHCLGSTS